MEPRESQSAGIFNNRMRITSESESPPGPARQNPPRLAVYLVSLLKNPDDAGAAGIICYSGKKTRLAHIANNHRYINTIDDPCCDLCQASFRHPASITWEDEELTQKINSLQLSCTICKSWEGQFIDYKQHRDKCHPNDMNDLNVNDFIQLYKTLEINSELVTELQNERVNLCGTSIEQKKTIENLYKDCEEKDYKITGLQEELKHGEIEIKCMREKTDSCDKEIKFQANEIRSLKEAIRILQADPQDRPLQVTRAGEILKPEGAFFIPTDDAGRPLQAEGTGFNSPHTKSVGSTFDFHIEDVLNKLEAIQRGNSQHEKIVSNEFYNEEGYRFKLIVHLNGDKSSSINDHLTAYIQIIKGENDDRLKWPYKNKIELWLLNEDHRPLVWGDILYSEKNASSFAKPSLQTTFGSAVGFHNFVAHNTLKELDIPNKNLILRARFV